MQDPKIKDALDLLSEVKGLLLRRRHMFERFLLSPFMRALIGGWALLLVGVSGALVIAGEKVVQWWVSSPWVWVVLVVGIGMGGAWLKLRVWKDLSPDQASLRSLFDALGKPLLVVDGVGIVIFVVLHVWIMLQGTWWYLFPLWAIGVGFVYVMYGAFLSLVSLFLVGVWSVLGGFWTLFWKPMDWSGVGLSLLVVFGLSYVGLFVWLEIQAHIRK
ncbi:MAG: hypothetical protein N2314_07985 [Brevinematales bacterium]|nr:hypothetical protein [Brevinematales bacterium]